MFDRFALLFLGVVGIFITWLGSDEWAIWFWMAGLMIAGSYIAFFGHRPFDFFSPLFFVGIVYALSYGYSVTEPLQEHSGPLLASLVEYYSYYPTAGCLAYWTLMFLWLGYNSRHGEKLGLLLARWLGRLLMRRVSLGQLKFVWFVLFASGLASLFLKLQLGMYFQHTLEITQSQLAYSAIGFFTMGLFAAVALAAALYFQYPSRYRKLLVLTMFIAVVSVLPSGSKGNLLAPFMMLALAYNYAKRNITRKMAASLMVAGAAFILVIFPFSSTYRQISGEHLTGSSGFSAWMDTIGFMREAIDVLKEEQTDELREAALDYVQGRLSSISVVGAVLSYQEHGGGLRYGETYLRLLYGFIPRFFWPDKPSLTLGHEVTQVVFGHWWDTTTSTGLGQVGELVYNFGVYLAPMFALFIGLLYRVVYVALMRSTCLPRPFAVTLYSVWWFVLIFQGQESGLAANLMGAIKYSVFIILLLLAREALSCSRQRTQPV